MAADTIGNLYYPLLCVYANLYPKMFLAKDPIAGAATLMDPANIATLTGGNITTCGFVPFTDNHEGLNDY